MLAGQDLPRYVDEAWVRRKNDETRRRAGMRSAHISTPGKEPSVSANSLKWVAKRTNDFIHDTLPEELAENAPFSKYQIFIHIPCAGSDLPRWLDIYPLPLPARYPCPAMNSRISRCLDLGSIALTSSMRMRESFVARPVWQAAQAASLACIICILVHLGHTENHS